MKNREKILMAIKSRKSLKGPYLSLGVILKEGGIETDGYLGMCAERIAEAELIDWEDVQIDFTNFPDLLLSADGVMECRDILKNYVSEKGLENVFVRMCLEESIRAEINMLAARLREARVPELIRTYIKCSDPWVRKVVITEAYHRTLLAEAARTLQSLFYNAGMKIKYHGLLSMIDRAAKACRFETE